MASGLGPLLRSAPLAATFFCFGHALIDQLLRRLNQDVGWLYFMAESLTAGERQYADFVEANPPLILWLYSLPAWFASTFHCSSILSLRFFILLSAALSLCLANQFLKRLFDPDQSVSRHLLLCAIGYLLTVFRGQDFGQREQLVAMALIPYAVSVAVRSSRGRGEALPPLLAVSAGLCAGLAISLKPLYLPAILLPELYLLWKERSISPALRREMWPFPVVGVGYLACIQVLAPEYFRVSLPLTLDCYWAYQEPFSSVFGFEQPAYLLASFLVARLAAAKAVVGVDRPLAPLANVLFLVGSGCYLAYLMGRTSWSYHLLPVWVCVFTLLAVAVLATAQRFLPGVRAEMSTTPLVFCRAGVLALVALVLVDWRVLPSAADVLAQDGDYLTSRNTKDRDLLRLQRFILANTSAKRSVHIISPLISPAFPLVNHAGLDWTSRFASSWVLLAATYAQAGKPGANLDAARIQELREYFIQSNLDDIRRYEPELILVEVSKNMPRFRRLRPNFLRQLAQDERFEAIWRHYHRVAPQHYHGRRFDVYRRSEAPHAVSSLRNRLFRSVSASIQHPVDAISKLGQVQQGGFAP